MYVIILWVLSFILEYSWNTVMEYLPTRTRSQSNGQQGRKSRVMRRIYLPLSKGIVDTVIPWNSVVTWFLFSFQRHNVIPVMKQICYNRQDIIFSTVFHRMYLDITVTLINEIVLQLSNYGVFWRFNATNFLSFYTDKFVMHLQRPVQFCHIRTLLYCLDHCQIRPTKLPEISLPDPEGQWAWPGWNFLFLQNIL